jgi:hypothetical protein
MAGSRPVSDMIGSSNRLGSGPRNTNYAGGNTSVVGVETTQPVLSEQAFRTWRQSDPVLSLESLLAQSAIGHDFTSVIDVGTAALVHSSDVQDQIRGMCADSGQRVPGSAPEMVRCILLSLAVAFRQTPPSTSGRLS